jgi:hypothetical protein
MTRPITNHAASVRARLLAQSRAQRIDFQRTLQRHVAERFLYRLGRSPHADRFVLKGAMLLVLWDTQTARPTKDVDLAGYWTNDAPSLVAVVREIIAVACPEDGVAFSDDVTAEPIRHRDTYHGFRVVVGAALAGARIKLQIDVGFGDAIEPPAINATYPVLLDLPAPMLRVYPREAAIAEKLHAMVVHGAENTRWKDFHDVYFLSTRFAFDGATLARAVAATFTRRKSAPLDGPPIALTSAFYEDADRAAQWRAFLQRHALVDLPADLASIGERVRAFLEPPLGAFTSGATYAGTWPECGPWQ